MNSAQSKDAGLLLLASIVILDQRQKSDDEHPLGGTDCRTNEPRSTAARLIPLFAAILLGGLIGLQRVRATKPSGLRTHTLVCLGTTVVLLSCSAAGISPEGASRVIQGIVIGIGFVGAGV